jgi:hypothetical protein
VAAKSAATLASLAVLIAGASCGDRDDGPRGAVTRSLARQGLLSVPIEAVEVQGARATVALGGRSILVNRVDGDWRVVGTSDP